MNNWQKILDNFILQVKSGDLKTSSYPKEWSDLRMRISFGMGMQAKVPWIAFVASEMLVSQGVYPVYLYYKDLQTLVLAYGVSETAESLQSWPSEVTGAVQTISDYFGKEVPRYGDSFVFKAYKVEITKEKVIYKYVDSDKRATEADIETDLFTILEYYKTIISTPSSPIIGPELSQGIFYMEKQLEDFIIYNWENTEFSKKYDLINEEKELLSQQFRTDVGPIDILAKDKKTGSYVVIELKRNQTSDDTIGQLTRYMGWIKEHKKDENVKGIIIAGQYDKKLDYARKMIPNIEVFIYQVDFKLNQFKK